MGLGLSFFCLSLYLKLSTTLLLACFESLVCRHFAFRNIQAFTMLVWLFRDPMQSILGSRPCCRIRVLAREGLWVFLVCVNPDALRSLAFKVEGSGLEFRVIEMFWGLGVRFSFFFVWLCQGLVLQAWQPGQPGFKRVYSTPQKAGHRIKDR